MDNYTFLNKHKQGYTLKVRVVPNSSMSKFSEVLDDGSIKLKLNSPPIEGKANKECVSIISKTFKVPKSSIKILQGEKSKNKVFLIKAIDEKNLEFTSIISKIL